jgi:hypothetical protein
MRSWKHARNAVIVVALLSVGCASALPILHGSSKDYPCGVEGQVCQTGRPPNDCCLEPSQEECGGDEPGCPAGQCCPNTPFMDLEVGVSTERYAAKYQAWRARIHPQTARLVR